MVSGRYTVCVAEDESRLLKNIVRKIEEADSDFTVVGQASNGVEALRLLSQMKVDVLFTDITMPLLNGLELIAEVKKVSPLTKIIILSGHDDFKFAQEAIKLGVENYHLKPLLMEDLKKSLDSLKEKLKESEQDEEKIFESILLRNSRDNALIDDRSRKCFLISASIGNLIKNAELIFKRGQALFGDFRDIQKDLRTLAGDTFQEKINPELYVIPSGLNSFYIILITDYEGERISETVSQLFEDCLSEIHQYLIGLYRSYPVTLIYESRWAGMEELYERAVNLRINCGNRVVAGKSQILEAEDNEKSKLEIPSTHIGEETKSRITILLEKGGSLHFREELEGLILKWLDREHSQIWFRKKLNRLLRFLQDNIFAITESIYLDLDLAIDRIIAATGEKRELARLLSAEISGIIPEKGENLTTGRIVELLIQYLNENYSRQISLERISTYFGFDKSYLTKIFKKHAKTTPIKLLTDIRIERAVGTIEENPHMELKEVARLCGYPDQHYFSRIFKKATGLTPSEKKAQVLLEKGSNPPGSLESLSPETGSQN